MTEDEAVAAIRAMFGPGLRVLKPCLTCGEPVDGTRCQGCSRARERERARRKARPYEWRRLSERLRSRSPFCERCGTTTDLTVDHRVPVSLGGDLLDIHNLRVFCRSCNSAAMAEQRRAAPGVPPRPSGSSYTAAQHFAQIEESPPGA
jgi:5-methylcytosine-specific restriction endonuclease McrA